MKTSCHGGSFHHHDGAARPARTTRTTRSAWRARAVATAVLLGMALTGAVRPAHAGRACEARPLTTASLVQGLQLAQRTAAALDASGAQVVLLARVGSDLSEYGLRYSHLGFAYRADERWLVTHKLNACGTASAALYRQGLGQFFMDDLFAHEAGFVAPTPAVQAAILAALDDPLRRVTLHVPAYSMVAYPWSQRYQQSNQWALETLALALERGVADRAGAQGWLRAHGYVPSVLHVGAMRRLGGQLGNAAIAFDDHPPDRRFAGSIATVTVDSVFGWMQREAMAGAVQMVRP